MNSKKIILLVVGLGVVVLLATYFFKADENIQTATTTESIESKPAHVGTTDSGAMQMGGDVKTAPAKTNPEKKKDFRYIQDRLTAMQERRPNKHFDPEEVAAAIERDVAWKPLKEVPKELPLKPEEFTDGREFISMDGLKIETLMPGDRMRLPIKALNKEYDVTIDNVEKHDYNSISWNGHIEGGDGRMYNVTFTRGESLTVGGMDTPDGQYEIQANGQNGWIASANQLFKNHVDPIDPKTITDPNNAQSQPHPH